MEIFHPLSNLHIAFEPSGNLHTRDLVLHFHGAHGIVFGAAQSRFPDAVASVINLNGLSAAYKGYVGRDPHWMFVKILAEVQQVTGVSTFSSITLSSFSAGYGAIRALLLDSNCVGMIDNVVLADTVYSSFGDARNTLGGRPFPSIEQNKPFIEFAKLAVRGRKGMIMTHCELMPETYSSTEEVGVLVRDVIAAPMVQVDEEWPGGLRVKGKIRKGRFASIATRGNQGSDHVAHLQHLSTWYRLLPRI